MVLVLKLCVKIVILCVISKILSISIVVVRESVFFVHGDPFQSNLSNKIFAITN